MFFVVHIKTSQSSQSIKIGIDLSINKSIKIGKSDLINTDCINQWVEIDDTLILFIDLFWFVGRYICSSVYPKMKTDYMQKTASSKFVDSWVSIESWRIKQLSLFKKIFKTKSEKCYLFYKTRFKIFFWWLILARFVGSQVFTIIRSTALSKWRRCTSQNSQSIKLGIDLSVDKLIKIGKSDLIDIDCIDQSVEVNDTRFVYQFIWEDTSVLLFIQKWKLISGKQCICRQYWVAIESRRIKQLSLLKKNLIFSLKPGLNSSSDGPYWPGL